MRLMARVSKPLLVPVAMAAIGVAIILYQWSAARPLWLDEEMIALNFRDRSFAELGGRLWLDQSAPLGWLAVQRLMLVALGSSELALRAIPAFFGVATVLAAFFIGWRWLTPAGCTVLVVLCTLGQWVSFHALELKPYSADTFWGLFLPALAASAASAAASEGRGKALAIWAAAAALGHWFSLGALLVLPACFVVLAMQVRRNSDGVRLLAIAFSIVITSVAIHYFVSIRHAIGSGSLQDYWQFAFPPQDAGIGGTLRWLSNQLQPVAEKPGGTSNAVSFWIAAVLGFAFAPASARVLGVTAGLVVLSGFALAGLRMMPLYERLSLWFVPALYLGIALFADRGVWLFQQKPPKRAWMNLAGAYLVFVLVVPLCLDVVDRGIGDLEVGRPRDSNHETDDRSAVGWLIRQRQPGDILITTRQALPAIWWYGGVRLSDGGGHQFSDGGGIFKVDLFPARPACRGIELERAIDGRHRILVHFGFVEAPPGFDDLLLKQLSTYGTITALRHFAGGSRAAVIDPSVHEVSKLFWRDAGKDTESLPGGCIAMRQARVW
jgi:hypothetical protein